MTLALSTVGEVVAIDEDGTRRSLDNDDHVRLLFHSVTDSFPEPPRIPTDPQAAERARQAQAAIEARKARNFTVTKGVDGKVKITLEDGTVATLPTAD